MKVLISIALIIMSYLYGSIPFALVIGKLFYHIDIREYGSGNLGGTNAGRILGKKVGFFVILLDATKCIVSMLISLLAISYFHLNHDIYQLSGLACIIGHCYPIFASFHGGKGVSSAMAFAILSHPITFIIALACFLITLKLTKYVSLSSMIGCFIFALVNPFFGISIPIIIINYLVALLVIYKHHDNIKRIIQGNENKVSWLK